MGRRVSVRRVVGRAEDGRPLFGDVVGDLVNLHEDRALIEHRGGLIEVPTAAIAIARLVPPSTADELALEAVAARGWRASHTTEIGGWLLRANGGFTGRANSILPLKPPGMPLSEAIDTARAWYAARGLPIRFAVPAESRRLLDAELGERGWIPSPDVLVLTARLDQLHGSDGGATIDVTPDDAWFSRYRDGAGAGDEARALLTRHDCVGFARVERDGATVAIGRGCVDDDWLGISAVEVAPEQRRNGLATSVMRALWRWGEANVARRSYLQVSSDNLAAVALYEKLGYRVHHAYRYRDAPESPPPTRPPASDC